MRKNKANLLHSIRILENLNIDEMKQDRWQTKLSTYAEIKPICEGRFETLEGLNFGHVVTEGYFIFKIRFLKGVTQKMRILFKNRLFEIKRIINIAERDRILNIITLEI